MDFCHQTSLASEPSIRLKCTDDWYCGLDTGQMTGLVFIDLKKAFDTVDHEILRKNSIFMVFKTESLQGSNLTCLIGNSLHEQMVQIQNLRKLI